MVKEGAVEHFGGAGEAASGSAVAVAWPMIAARVTMGKEDSRAPARSRILDDFTDRKAGAALIALMTGNVETAGLLVDMGDPEAVLLGVGFGEAPLEEIARGGDTAKLQWEFDALVPHWANLLDRMKTAHSNRVGYGAKMEIAARAWTLLPRRLG